MSGIDVSVVLNLHREALLIGPTLRSLQRCGHVAREHGIVVELIAVFDRSDQATREGFRAHDLGAFLRVREVEVDVGSLGLARNAGIEHAQGEFIWTSDADDLVSSNCIVALLETARSHPSPKVAVFVEYLCAFGEQYHNVRYVDSQQLTAADFAFQHPYVSRIFVRRAAFDLVRYEDLRVTSGFAYEDWHLNCELRALGYDMTVAPDTVFFYRQRAGSLLKQANAASVRLIPHSRLFEAETFLADMRSSRVRVGDWGEFVRTRRVIHEQSNTDSFMVSRKLTQFLRDAVELEPEIEPNRVETADSYSPVPWDARHWGTQLESLYRMLGSRKFTDVVLLPWLKPGGAEKYMLQVLNEIAARDPSSRMLVIAGETAMRHEWANRLPKSAVFVDIYNAFPSLSVADRDALLLRAMLATSEPDARLHVKSSVFAHRLLDAYAPVLSNQYRTVYYRFSDGTYKWKDMMLRGPWGINIMRRHLPGFWKVLNDCNAIAGADAQCIGVSAKYETIYARCDQVPVAKERHEPTRRLLWASRVAPEKRPELVAKIVEGLRREGIEVVVEAYGAAESSVSPNEVFSDPAIRYHGGFNEFAELPVENFDAFLYTSSHDGLPNVILEAMSAGLPVIAPDIGGIREAVIDGLTGRLIAADDDQAIVQSYMQAIASMYTDWPATQRLSLNGRRLIDSQHGAEAFSSRVAKVFCLGSDAVQRVA